ncbi:MAG: hypothetical protein LIP23_04285 [Planctomycetes bacterium]|nr:hypothetical protein [Planctomycetota bacterium]
MTNESKAMDEIHMIRAKLYDETKTLSAEEHTAYYRIKAEDLAKKHGITLRRPSSSVMVR